MESVVTFQIYYIQIRRELEDESKLLLAPNGFHLFKANEMNEWHQIMKVYYLIGKTVLFIKC